MKSQIQFFITTLILCSICQTTYAQTDPEFDTFKGEVYTIPFKNAKKSYGEHVYDYHHIGSLEWKGINVSKRSHDIPFPDVSKTELFGIVFNSTITINEEACYEFSLNSDDGSKLWIEEEFILDNGGNHAMQLKKDSFVLQKGTYPIKIWYQQLYPNMYGVIFNAKNVGKPEFCPKIFNQKKEVEPVFEKISLNSQVLYDTKEYKIKKEGEIELDSICNIIKTKNPKKITFIGHTDSSGNSEMNEKLSYRRAEHLMKIIMNRINQPGIQYIAKGMGENSPIDTNETPEGRMKNRRVEIIFE